MSTILPRLWFNGIAAGTVDNKCRWMNDEKDERKKTHTHTEKGTTPTCSSGFRSFHLTSFGLALRPLRRLSVILLSGTSFLFLPPLLFSSALSSYFPLSHSPDAHAVSPERSHKCPLGVSCAYACIYYVYICVSVRRASARAPPRPGKKRERAWVDDPRDRRRKREREFGCRLLAAAAILSRERERENAGRCGVDDAAAADSCCYSSRVYTRVRLPWRQSWFRSLPAHSRFFWFIRCTSIFILYYLYHSTIVVLKMKKTKKKKKKIITKQTKNQKKNRESSRDMMRCCCRERHAHYIYDVYSSTTTLLSYYIRGSCCFVVYKRISSQRATARRPRHSLTTIRLFLSIYNTILPSWSSSSSSCVVALARGRARLTVPAF